MAAVAIWSFRRARCCMRPPEERGSAIRAFLPAEIRLRSWSIRWQTTIVDLAGNKKSLSANFYSIEGLAWDPNGNAVWFSGNELGPYARRALFKVTTTGQQHLVRRESGNLTVRDASRSGRLALTRDTSRGEVFGRIDPDNKERELGWLDSSIAYDVSPDGSTIALSVQGEAASG